VLEIHESQGIQVSGNFIRGNVAFTGQSSGVLIASNLQLGGDIEGAGDHVSTLNLIGNSGFTDEGGNNRNVVSLPTKITSGYGETTFKRMQLGTLSWTPGEVPALGAGYLAIEHNVHGVYVGDAISVGISPAIPPGLVLSATVVDLHTVRVTVHNLTTAPITIADASTIQVHATSG
jgi:hypothetical protein